MGKAKTKKKVKKNVQSGIAHIQSTFNNTIVTITDVSGNVVAWSSAASCAANGVDLREPLKPHVPADDHATTFPLTSVIETMVLLNVAEM